jgi:nicotinate-nucleotide adenylyltransferase
MRLGIFGGSFDPVHYGHLLLGECCREACQLDQIWFLPAAQPPHKRNQLRATGQHRIAMLELAIADQPAFGVSQMELERGGVSYTVDTLTAIHAQRRDAELFLLLGADMLADLPTWRQPATICQLATPMVVRRAGTPAPDFAPLAHFLPQERLDRIRAHLVDMPPIGLSSTEIRARVAAGRTVRYQTTPEVVRYIEAEGLYLLP